MPIKKEELKKMAEEQTEEAKRWMKGIQEKSLKLLREHPDEAFSEKEILAYYLGLSEVASLTLILGCFMTIMWGEELIEIVHDSKTGQDYYTLK